MYDAMRRLLDSGRYTIIESFVLPGREAVFKPVPKFLSDSPVGHFLEHEYVAKGGLWRHQAIALEALSKGRNVVVPTGTASGKSLVFRAAAFYCVLRDRQARVLVFYPLKALAGDQLRGWQGMAIALGLPAETIGRIDGSVRSMQEREQILETAQVVLMTPDVCHAWLMSRLSAPVMKEFLARLAIVVMDEAHTLEGVFGSNFAFLIRRLLTARHYVVRNAGTASQLQFIAATATISNPTAHLQALTGVEFDLIDESLDGSPRSERLCAHVAAPSEAEMEVARHMQLNLLSAAVNGGFITFIDSRKGVEMLARNKESEMENLLVTADVLPYRAGYDARDREAIERRLQQGTLRGVVSTSALELGIDLPHLTVGLNVGVPATRKAYRQRLGRTGRSSGGVFVVITPPDGFSGYGTSFREYHDMSVEESYLYLDNRFMQFAHARCLVDELEAVGAGRRLPAQPGWPEGFSELLECARPGGNRPPAFDAIAQLGGDSPHLSYPLRNVGEVNFKIAQGDGGEPFGEVSESQALRECYPGATYLHMGRPWEVVAWLVNAFRPYIRVRPTAFNRLTKPRIRTWINAGTTPADLIEQHFLCGEAGFLAECQMQVTEKVEGYEELNTEVYRPYAELRQRNPNMRPRTRNFRTSGVILCIAEPWFAQGDFKQHFADRLTAVFAREYSVLSQDIGSAATNIAVRSGDGGGPRSDCIVIFDQIYGSLRLTERLFLRFDHLLERIVTAANVEGGADAEAFAALVQRLRQSVSRFSSGVPEAPAAVAFPTGFIQVFNVGSRVCYRERGRVGTEVEIVRPTIMNGNLMYQVRCPPRPPANAPVMQWVNAQFVEVSAEGEWEYAWWNTATEVYENPPERGEAE